MRTEANAARRQPGGTGQSGAGSNRLYTHDSTDKRRAQPRYGIVAGDVWLKTAHGSKHMLRAPKAWAMDVADLDAAERCAVRFVRIHDLESLRHYWATTHTVRARGFIFNRGHNHQIGLALEHWQDNPGDAEDLGEPEPEAVQGALW